MKNYTSQFIRHQSANVVYVIHELSWVKSKFCANLEFKSKTLPYMFKTRQQANRYLKDVLGASVSHGEFITDNDGKRKYYKVQHLSEITEYQIRK